MFLSRLALLLVLTFSIYSVMLGSWFKTLDDEFSILSNQTIQQPHQWAQLFKEGYFRDKSYYRPLTNMSYAFEHQVHGFNSFYYNLDNLILHLLNALLVWWLIALLVNPEIGFWVALLFAVHPIQWESVSNISGRAILLSTFFSLAMFIAFIKRRVLASVLLFALGLLCKESTAIMPGIMFIWAWQHKKRLTPFVWFAVVTIAYLALRKYLGITEFFAWRNPQEAALGFVTFLRSVITHLQLLLLPLDLHFDRSYKLFDTLINPQAIFAILFWLMVFAALCVYRQRIKPIHWLCLAWFILTLLPISQIVTTIGVQPGYISAADHFLYFTCIAVFCSLCVLLIRVKSKLFAVLGVVAIAFFSVKTMEQNFYASSELAMLERSLAIQPNNARLNSSVALLHAFSGRSAKAEEYFRRAVRGDPYNPRYQISLGKSICDQGRYQECLDVYNAIQYTGGFDKLLHDNKAAAQQQLEKSRQELSSHVDVSLE